MIFETYLTLKALGFALGLANDPKTDTVKVDREIVKTDLTDTLECDCQGSLVKSESGREYVALRDLCGKRPRLHYRFVFGSARRLYVSGWMAYNVANRPAYLTGTYKDGQHLPLAPLVLGGDALKDSLGWLTYKYDFGQKETDITDDAGTTHIRAKKKITFTLNPDLGNKVTVREYVQQDGVIPWVNTQTFGCVSPIHTDTIEKRQVKYLERK